jgi:hypothetical protein
MESGYSAMAPGPKLHVELLPITGKEETALSLRVRRVISLCVADNYRIRQA